MLLGSAAAEVAVIAVIAAYLAAGLATLLKAKWASFVAGIFFVPVWLVAAIRLARPGSWWARSLYDEGKRERARVRQASRRYRAIVAAGLLLSLSCAAVVVSLIGAYRIPSSSMQPTLRCPSGTRGCTGEAADRVVSLRHGYGKPERGDIVVYRTSLRQVAACGAPRGSLYIHRVIGLPGEQVSEERGTIKIDGQPLDEPYVADEADSPSFPSVAIPRDHYFVLGDNRAQSCDSSAWGPLPRDNIVGRVVFIYWPIGRIGLP